jgi:hypothetical protein
MGTQITLAAHESNKSLPFEIRTIGIPRAPGIKMISHPRMYVFRFWLFIVGRLTREQFSHIDPVMSLASK